MTLILIKKDEFYLQSMGKDKVPAWTLNQLKAINFAGIQPAEMYLEKHLKDCKNCKVVTVDVEFKEKHA